MIQVPPAGAVVATPEAPTSAEPTLEGRFRYRLFDLRGTELAAVECEQVVHEDAVLQLDGRPWRVVNTIGCAARVTKVKWRSGEPAPSGIHR